MIKKVWFIFMRDVKVNTREFLALFLLLVPMIFGIGIQLLAPSVNDTTIRLAMLDSDDSAKRLYLEQFAKVEQFEDVDGLTARVERRDNIVGLLPDGAGSYILAQGNEPESVTDYAKTLNAFHALELDVAETTATFESFGRTEPPLKKMLVNVSMLVTSMLAGMLIAINIIEEKMDNTVSAISVSPISRVGFILGKSLIGIFLALYGALALVLITGYTGINFGQMLLAILSVTLISLLIGFIQGLVNEDVMEAAAGVKIVGLPLAAGVAGAELLNDTWQIALYWNPFYWTYRSIKAVLSYTATWPQIVGYTVIVLALGGVVYYFLAPKIQVRLA